MNELVERLHKRAEIVDSESTARLLTEAANEIKGLRTEKAKKSNVTSILQDWVTELPIRHQGVLLAAVRGCDSTPKECSAKPLTRALRYAFMHPADPREVDMNTAFMKASLTLQDTYQFIRDWDHYPIHFVQHIMHACQVIGYYHPDTATRKNFDYAYFKMVRKLHLNVETKEQMDDRLTEDRIARYGNATGEQQ